MLNTHEGVGEWPFSSDILHCHVLWKIIWRYFGSHKYVYNIPGNLDLKILRNMNKPHEQTCRTRKECWPASMVVGNLGNNVTKPGSNPGFTSSLTGNLGQNPLSLNLNSLHGTTGLTSMPLPGDYGKVQGHPSQPGAGPGKVNSRWMTATLLFGDAVVKHM